MIDIIIPAYNAHDTISKTLISICMQSIVDKVNVYIVNDCSLLDYSSEIALFSCLNIHELKLDVNSGPGVARQYGINESSGEFILFLDSDDLLYNKFSLERLYNGIMGYDMAVGSIIDEREQGYYVIDNHTGCLHGKLYRRKFINKYNLGFNDTRSSEDNSFNNLCLLADPRINYVKDVVYLYKYNVNSLSNTSVKLNDIKMYIYNVKWVIDEAFSKGFGKYKISRYYFSSVVYLYFVYVTNFNNKKISALIGYMNDIIGFYDDLISLLSDDDKVSIYKGYDCGVIPMISFYDFIDLCRK